MLAATGPVEVFWPERGVSALDADGQPFRDPAADLACREALDRELTAATGPVAVFVPRRGVSTIDVDGQPFRDAEADAALFEELREGLDPSVEVHELDLDLNDDRFADAMADRLHELIEAAR